MCKNDYPQVIGDGMLLSGLVDLGTYVMRHRLFTIDAVVHNFLEKLNRSRRGALAENQDASWNIDGGRTTRYQTGIGLQTRLGVA